MTELIFLSREIIASLTMFPLFFWKEILCIIQTISSKVIILAETYFYFATRIINKIIMKIDAVFSLLISVWLSKKPFRETMARRPGLSRGEPPSYLEEDEVYLVTALVPSETACLASSPGRSRRTAV